MLTKKNFSPMFAWSYSNRGYAFDSAKNGLNFPKDYAFDAASGSGMAFLASMLEVPNVDLVMPLAAVTHPRDIPIKTGGGFVEFASAWAVDYATTGGNQYGLQGTEKTNLAMITTNVIKGTWPVINWAASMFITFLDLQRLIDAKRLGIPAPYSLQDLLDKGVKLVWGKALDRVTYLGWDNNPGLINDTNVSYSLAAAGAQGSTIWTKKTTTEIQNDINTVLLNTLEASGYDPAGMADTILVDFEHWGYLNQPMTIGGFNSALEFILANNVARRMGIDLTILPLPDDWISTQGTGSPATRMVAYRKDTSAIYLTIAQPLIKVMTVPTVAKGMGYETAFAGAIGIVQKIRPTTIYYLDQV
jgi:hypothetical protein